jgi:sugar O-acyltransferase (sialic acid O-acetyltransferase NeuD family)
MADVVMFGAGEFAEVALACLSRQSEHRVIGITTEERYLPGKSVFGLPATPFERVEKEIPPGQASMFVAVGPSKCNTLRARIYHAAKAKGYTLITHVSPRAMLAPEVPIGDNCFLFDGVIVESCCRVGCDTIFWSGAVVAHHTAVGDHCFLAPQAAVSGCCEIEDYAFLGINCTIRDHVRIGTRSIIGAGATIKKDTEPGSVYSQARTRLYRSDSSDVQL